MRIWLSLYEAYVYRTKGYKTKCMGSKVKYRLEPITKNKIVLYLYEVK